MDEHAIAPIDAFLYHIGQLLTAYTEEAITFVTAETEEVREDALTRADAALSHIRDDVTTLARRALMPQHSDN